MTKKELLIQNYESEIQALRSKQLSLGQELNMIKELGLDKELQWVKETMIEAQMDGVRTQIKYLQWALEEFKANH